MAETVSILLADPDYNLPLRKDFIKRLEKINKANIKKPLTLKEMRERYL